MKRIIYSLKKALLKPPYVKWSSQTIYQSLIGCIKLYKYNKDILWKERANKLYKILSDIQQADGGFDIGYDFNFGLLHKKGESTSPEMIGLIAFIDYGRCFGFDEELNNRCYRAVEWIRLNAKELDNGEWYIPYGPYSTSEIMVYNGTSFVCGALGYFIGTFKSNDLELEKIYNGMVKYLDGALVKSNEYDGRYWPYYDQNRKDIVEPLKSKIDNYHQMQQVEVHGIAQLSKPNSTQQKLIIDSMQYILALFNKEGYVPYANNNIFFGGNVHVWGFASIISAVKVCIENEYNDSRYFPLVKYVEEFLIKNSWNNNYFTPILSLTGVNKYNEYMVRSDAWVFNSLSNLFHLKKFGYEFDEVLILNILERCYYNMENCNFSGIESHASTVKTRFISSIISKFKK